MTGSGQSVWASIASRSWVNVCLVALCSMVPLSAFAQVGIANKYSGDQGIVNDPDVIFAENFEAPLTTILSRFKGHSGNAVVKSSEKPASSSGSGSVVIHPAGGILYSMLPSDYSQLYFRYYIKYGGADYHHSGAYLGGYSPRSAWPMGDAGLRGIRPDGSRLVNIGFETQGAGSESDPDTRLDTYMNWVNMAGQAIAGGWWGRSMVANLNIPIRPNTWQCVELMVKMNSAPTTYDGELAIWVDGVKRIHFLPGSPNGQYNSFTGNWEMNPSGAPFPGFLWRDILGYGLNWVKVQNYDDIGQSTDLWVDDLVVATKYIGPINPGGSNITPPSAPTSLQVIP